MNIPGMGDTPSVDEITDKVKDNVDFPASKDDIVNAAEKIPGLEKAKDFLEDRLPDKQFNSVQDLKSSINL